MGRGGGSPVPYILGMVAFGGLIVVLVLYRDCDSGKEETQTAAATASVKPQRRDDGVAPAYNMPPPPEEEDLDAGADAAAAPSVAGTGGPKLGGPVPKGACEECGQGVTSGALNSAVSGRASTSHGCYDRALRAGAAQGQIVVSVAIGNDGSVCNTSIASDTLGVPGVSQCVLGKFRSGGYPKPKEGCVVINVPINFKVR